MTCPGCKRDNRLARRYCGGCGCNFEPACDSCGFANDREDRFCGGCGQALRVAGRHARPGVVPAQQVPAPAATAPTAASVWDANELAALFAPAPTPEQSAALPEVGISQNDVDRLFGDAL